MNLNILTKNNIELFWDVSDVSKLDNLAIEERFLKYGNWKNILDLQSILGYNVFKDLYLKIRDKKRSNLSDKTINFFNLYLNV